MTTPIRMAIVAGQPADVERFVETTIDEGMVWWDVPDDYRPVAPKFPFSRKLAPEEVDGLRRVANENNVTMART